MYRSAFIALSVAREHRADQSFTPTRIQLFLGGHVFSNFKRTEDLKKRVQERRGRRKQEKIRPLPAFRYPAGNGIELRHRLMANFARASDGVLANEAPSSSSDPVLIAGAG